MTMRPCQSLRLGDLQGPIERDLNHVVSKDSACKVQVGPLLRRWITMGLRANVANLPAAARKKIGELPQLEVNP